MSYFTHLFLANFRELRKAEVQLPRIYLLGTSVNKSSGNTPDSSGWHHVHGVDPVEKGELASGGGHSFVGGSADEQGTGAPLLGGTGQGRPGRSEGDDGPPLRRSSSPKP